MVKNQKTIGVLGGGQLGRMMQEAAHRLGVELVFVDPQQDSPAKQLSNAEHIHKAFTDKEAIFELASKVDVITMEIEHVDTSALTELSVDQMRNGKAQDFGAAGERDLGIYPSPKVIEVIQDKYIQHRVLKDAGIAVADFSDVESVEQAITIGERYGYPYLLKSKRGAYDGRGNVVVKAKEDIRMAWDQLTGGGCSNITMGENGTRDSGIYAEKMVNFDKEIAVMVVKGLKAGETESYPIVETIQKNNICHVVYAPAGIDGLLMEKAKELAEKAVESICNIPYEIECDGQKQKVFGNSAGVFGVEMFLLQGEGEILVNEIAPRPHNSGHYTIEACETSQFENHIRSVLGMPIGSTNLKVPNAAMVNILGVSNEDECFIEYCKAHNIDSAKTSPMDVIVNKLLAVKGSTVHMYGKSENKKGRKMGHVTVVGDSAVVVEKKVKEILGIVNFKTPENSQPRQVETGTVQSGYKPAPLVAIIMGSDSDLPVMKQAAVQLEKFNVPYELTIVSAHRTAHRMVEYATNAHKRGFKVIIAGAGGAAHLPGMVAALTPLPVIGVPVKGRTLDGVDSLYSIVQMPSGIPVATVAINNADNAGILAARILASSSGSYLDGVQAQLDNLNAEVSKKIDRIEQVGWRDY
ncbi:phosphoribosylaminoimidazole carboxylase [Zancudomyces culisetae]|uniref:Phosphoribosylaminoimidazole carboxylase n=1 Tax=Zancudomyces culisetae TaxID=1213189 RepID=A0A1R1PTY9_ZANCU|nr:phosphoribosylaminoimidazole carboxylase [Zancudomyces culisetae]|eukprot:OMH84414.1 phosphoribosylaminoimidazole carboxylase [Zancudomyces culisetae]